MNITIRSTNRFGASANSSFVSDLLDKQLKQLQLTEEVPPSKEDWAKFLKQIRAAYDGYDQDRYLLEQAMAVSSDEMRELMTEIKSRNTQLEEEVAQHAITAERLHYRATHDLLTGLASRQVLLERMGLGLLRIREESHPRIAALFVDLDNFKRINDCLGHDAGDRVLIEVANRLSAACSPFDQAARKTQDDPKNFAPSILIARIGGDEFVVFMSEVHDEADAGRCAQAICDTLREPIAVEENMVNIGSSVGIAFGDATHESANDVLRDADIAMYRAKSTGKSRYAVFDRAMYEQTVSRLTTEQELRRSIRDECFEIHYQPKVDLLNGSIEGFEALIRWNHPEDGLIGPNEFIHIAEDTGLIVPLGDWILRRVCHDLRGWNQRNPGQAEPLHIAVNLSRLQMDGKPFVDKFLQILEQEQIPPEQIIVEVTEHAVTSKPVLVLETIHGLRDAGVKIHMDDFGTGESSLSALHKLPLDAVKIDRSFIARAESNRKLIAIVDTIIALAHNLGLKVVVEGVERFDQIALLQACSCDLGQGYYFARPLPAEEAEAMLSGGNSLWPHDQKRNVG